MQASASSFMEKVKANKKTVMIGGAAVVGVAAVGLGVWYYYYQKKHSTLKVGDFVSYEFVLTEDHADFMKKKGDKVTYYGVAVNVDDPTVITVQWEAIDRLWYRSDKHDAAWDDTYIGKPGVAPKGVVDVPATFKRDQLSKISGIPERLKSN